MTTNQQTTMPDRDGSSCDVLVMGGGPGGSTVSAFLAMKGWDVVMLDKGHHPRFHIGESMLPRFMPIVEKLGLLDEVHRIGIKKPGADFNAPDYDPPRRDVDFSQALDASYPYAFEVRRSEFDQLLFENSRKKGTRAHEGVRIADVQLGSGGRTRVATVSEEGVERTYECRYLVDATGRDTFMAKKMGLRDRNPRHGSAAIFAHFMDVDRREGELAGNISVYWFEHGWFWLIPLLDGTMSIGAVCTPEYLKARRVSPEQYLLETLKMAPAEMRHRMRAARIVNEVRATGNYSYQCRRMYGDGWLMVGDAYAFIDPVFSSGVLMAMSNGMHAADVIDAILRGAPGTSAMLRRYERRVKRGIATFSWFIERFNTPGLRALFMTHDHPPMKLREAVTSVLTGDVYGNFAVDWRLSVFKAIYVIESLVRWRDWKRSIFQRRRNATVVFEGGTTEQDAP